jgi:hypothetical protein
MLVLKKSYFGWAKTNRYSASDFNTYVYVLKNNSLKTSCIKLQECTLAA